MQRILVVDDEFLIARLCQQALQGAGYHALAITQPAAALQALAAEQTGPAGAPFDLLLADLVMPEMNGFELLERARRIQPDLACILMTGMGTLETAIEALRRGVDGLTLKPFTTAELLDSVEMALDSHARKQDVQRLWALRPLFGVTEAFFAQTDPAQVSQQLVTAAVEVLRCSIAGLFSPTGALEVHAPAAGRETDIEIIKRLVAKFLAQDAGHSDAGRLDAGIQANRSDEDDGGMHYLIARLRPHQGQEYAEPEAQRQSRHPSRQPMSAAILLAARQAEQPPFAESEIETFHILCHQGAAALENTRLHAELLSSFHRLEESQRLLIQTEKMATAGRLIASIAHEINNPLQAVQNCLHLANRRELSRATRLEYMNLAQTELERLINTVQRMLDFYRPGRFERKATDVHDLLARVLQLLKGPLKEHNIQVRLNLAPETVYPFLVSELIQQVFFNLIINAIDSIAAVDPDKFLPPKWNAGNLAGDSAIGGEITISSEINRSASKIAGEEIAGDEIAIYIADNGVGVPPEVRQHLFEPFTSSKENGTGLGLALSYGIMTSHGGTLELVSPSAAPSGNPAAHDSTRGACFCVRLPLGDMPPNPHGGNHTHD